MEGMVWVRQPTGSVLYFWSVWVGVKEGRERGSWGCFSQRTTSTACRKVQLR